MPQSPHTARFAENAVISGAAVHRVAAATTLAAAVRAIVPEGAVIYCPGISPLERALRDVLPPCVDDYVRADITIEEVFAGIAETGSIVCTSAEGRAVQASLVPAHHIALLPVSKLHHTLDACFAALAAAPPVNITLITGPSRTADIELTLAIGVHGPGRLDILLVG